MSRASDLSVSASPPERGPVSRRRLIGAAGLGAAGIAIERLHAPDLAWGTDPTPTDEGWLNVKDTFFAGGAKGDGTTDDRDAISAAINYAIIHPDSVVFFPPGEYLISGTLDTIKGADTRIIGSGAGVTRLQMTSAGNGTFFQIGDPASAITSHISLSDMSLICQGQPDDGQNAFHITNCASIYIDHIELTNVAGLCKCGSGAGAANKAHNYAFRNVSGTYHPAVSSSRIWIQQGVRGRFINVHLTSTDSAGGRGIFVDAKDLCDTAYFDNVAVWGDHPTGAGIAYGVLIDFTSGGIYNLFFRDCLTDATTQASVRIQATSGANPLRQVRFSGCYLKAPDGPVVWVAHSGTGNMTSISFIDNTIRYRDSRAVVCDGDAISDIKFIGNDFIDEEPATVKNAAMSMGCSNWSAIGNHYGPTAGSGLSGTKFFGETRGTDIDDFAVIGNVGSGTTQGFFNDAATYTSASADRIVSDNSGQVHYLTVASVATVTLPDHADMLKITGTTQITTIKVSWPGRQVSLRFTAAGGGITDGSNLHLDGNMPGAVDNTITLFCDGTNWYELARTVH